MLDHQIMARRSEIERHHRNHHYEASAHGVLFPRINKAHGGLFIGGAFTIEGSDGAIDVDANLFTSEGLNHLLELLFASAWYMAPFSGDVAVSGAWTAANFASTATEITSAYDESTRPLYDRTITGAAVSNSASKATFTANTTVTVRGIALLSVSTKGATTGKLLSAARLGADKPLTAAESVAIQYDVSAADGS